MSARDEVLARVRGALGDGSRRTDVPQVPRTYRRESWVEDPVGLFAARVADYRAVVGRVPRSAVAAGIARALEGAGRVVVPEGFPASLLGDGLPEGTERVHDTGLSEAELDRVDAVLTTATVGIAVTGTVVLDHGPGQGRRALTLVPDHHVCVITADQIVGDVPAAVERLDPLRPQTWVSGPSATSDIELSRVEGVHGPRRLHVIVVDPD
jgi:L-lactate dehydrogenase complex protein LldG